MDPHARAGVARARRWGADRGRAVRGTKGRAHRRRPRPHRARGRPGALVAARRASSRSAQARAARVGAGRADAARRLALHRLRRRQRDAALRVRRGAHRGGLAGARGAGARTRGAVDRARAAHAAGSSNAGGAARSERRHRPEPSRRRDPRHASGGPNRAHPSRRTGSPAFERGEPVARSRCGGARRARCRAASARLDWERREPPADARGWRRAAQRGVAARPTSRGDQRALRHVDRATRHRMRALRRRARHRHARGDPHGQSERGSGDGRADHSHERAGHLRPLHRRILAGVRLARPASRPARANERGAPLLRARADARKPGPRRPDRFSRSP